MPTIFTPDQRLAYERDGFVMIHSLFDAKGELSSNDTRDFLRKFMESYAAWVETNAKRA